MSLMKRNGNLYNTFPSLFNDDFFTRDLFNWGLSNNSNTGTTIPAVNIKETPNSFEVEMAAPGMKKNDFRIELGSRENLRVGVKVNRGPAAARGAQPL